ncbi:MAG: hypothetical protein WC162_02770 [Sphaerochaetaceae bacterium]
MSKKSVVVLILLLAIEFCNISASDVMISWNWEDIEYSPLYSRYQLDGLSNDGWTQLDGDKNKIYFEVDTSKEHDFYIETTYDGWVWSKPSVILIPKKALFFTAKLELDKVDLNLLFEKNKVTVDLSQSMDKESLKDFFTFFVKKTKIDSSQFNLSLDSNKVVIEAPDSFYESDVRLLKMLFNSVFDEWQTMKAKSVIEPVSDSVTAKVPLTLETEIVENGCSFVMVIKDDTVTITCDKGFSLPAFQSLSAYMLKNLDYKEKAFTYSFTSDSVIFTYPESFNSMDFEDLKNTIKPLFHTWYVEYNKLEVDETPAVEEVTNIPSSDLKPEIKTLSPTFQTEIVENGCSFVLKVKDNTATITCDKGFSLPAFQSLSKYMLENLNLEIKDFTYSYNLDSIVISYPEYINSLNLQDIKDTIKPLFHTWYVDYNKPKTEETKAVVLPVLLNREYALGDYLVKLMVNSEIVKISSDKAVSSDALESLIGYMIDNFKLNPADYSYSLTEDSLIITYPDYLKKMNIEDIENQVTPALYDWYYRYNNKKVVLDTSLITETESKEAPPVDGPEVALVEKEELMGTVNNLEVNTVKQLKNTSCLSFSFEFNEVRDWGFQNLIPSFGVDFSQNFFNGTKRFALGYVVGLNFNPNAALKVGETADMYFGLKTGLDLSYALGKEKNFFLTSNLGLLVSWSKTDILNTNFASPVLGAFVGGGIKFVINDNLMLGLKCNYNHHF